MTSSPGLSGTGGTPVQPGLTSPSVGPTASPTPTLYSGSVDQVSTADQTGSTSTVPSSDSPGLAAPVDGLSSELTAAQIVELIGKAIKKNKKETKSAEEMAMITGSQIQKVLVGPPKNPDGSPSDSPVPPDGPAPQQTMNVVTADNMITSTLSSPVYESIRVRLGRPLPQHLVNSLLAGVPRAGALGTSYSTLPALRKLGDPTLADANDPNVALAQATAEQQYFQKILSSNVIKDAATESVTQAIDSLPPAQRALISPEDQQAMAQIVASQIGFYFAQDSILKVSAALDLPGLPAQVSALAGLPANPSYAFTNPAARVQMKNALTDIAVKEKNMDHDEAEKRIDNALKEIGDQPGFTNSVDFQEALQNAFLHQFDNDQRIANTLSDAALKVAANISIPPPPDFSGQLIKEEALKTSLKEMLIVRGMDVHEAQEDAEKIARNVQANADSFKTESDARNFLESELRNTVSNRKNEEGVAYFDEKNIHTVSVRANLGLPPTDPLEIAGFSGKLSADEGENRVQLKALVDKHLDKLEITNPNLRQDVYAALGLEKSKEGNSVIDLLNEYHKASFIEKKPFLNLDGTAAVNEFIRKTSEPALIYLQINAGPMASMRLDPAVFHRGLDISV